MQKYRVEMTKQADRDLISIGRWIAKRSPQGAVTMTNRIIDAIVRLEDSPHRNIVPPMPGLKRPVRSMPVDSHMVFFRV